MVSPSQKRRAVQGVVQAGLCSQRRACRYLGVHRSSHRHEPKQPSDWLLRLHAQIETFSHKYPRLGYRKLVRLLRKEGWQVGRKQSAAHPARARVAGQAVDEAAPATRSLHWHHPHQGAEGQPRLELGLPSVIAPTTGASCASSRSSTSTAESAWPSTSRGNSRRLISSRSWNDW